MDIKVCCGDVLEVMKKIPNESVDLVFADPPFNIGLKYGEYDDNRSDYREWVQNWIDVGIRKIKDGGVFVVHHVPQAAMWIGEYMKGSIKFNSWIAWKTHTRPPSNRVTPEHRAFLIFSKGKSKFHTWGDTAAHRKCKSCGAMIANWSGNKKYMNPEGNRVSDVWTDINQVRKKQKRREENELPVRAMERFVNLYTDEGDMVLDMFAGSGSMAEACKKLNRRYIGIEKKPQYCWIINERLNEIPQVGQESPKEDGVGCEAVPDGNIQLPKNMNDQEQCYTFLERLIHPDGLRCPNGHSLEQAWALRDRGSLTDYRCSVCKRYFNVFSNTNLRNTNLSLVQLVQIIKGIKEGVSAAKLANELGISRKTLGNRMNDLRSIISSP